MGATSMHVVIAEPDPALRSQLVGIVAEAATEADIDVTVHETSTGTSALAACGEHQPRLLLGEVLLDGVSGLALLRRLENESTASTVVIFVTDLAHEHDRYWGLRNGAVAYFAKPIDTDPLRAKIARVLRDGPASVRDAPAPI